MESCVIGSLADVRKLSWKAILLGLAGGLLVSTQASSFLDARRLDDREARLVLEIESLDQVEMAAVAAGIKRASVSSQRMETALEDVSKQVTTAHITAVSAGGGTASEVVVALQIDSRKESLCFRLLIQPDGSSKLISATC